MQAAFANVEPRARVPRNRESHEVRHRTAGHEEAVRLGGQSQQLDQPPDHLILDDRGRVVELGDLWIHSGGQHIRQHREGAPRADHPAPEPRMDVAGRVGEYIALEFFVDVGRRGRFARRGGAGQPFADVGGHGAPDGALPHGPQVLEHLVHHAVAELAQLLPVPRALGVEAKLRRGPRSGRRRARARGGSRGLPGSSELSHSPLRRSAGLHRMNPTTK